MAIVDPDTVEKELNEFEEAFNESDEERKETEPVDDTKTDVDGESKEDQSTDVDTTTVTEDPIQAGVSPEPATDGTDWKAKAEELEVQLKRENQRTSSWDGRIKAANKRVKDLEAEIVTLKSQLEEKKSDEVKAEDLSDEEKMKMFREGFPELTDAFDIMQKKIDRATKVEAKTEPEPDVDEPATVVDEPSNEPSDHYKAVTAAHPELDEIVNTGVLLTYINTQSDTIKNHLSDIYFGRNKQGSSEQVIKLVTEFKTKTGWKSQLEKTQEAAADSKQEKLNSMLETENASAGPKADGPDKDDFEGTAKEIGL